MKKKEQPKAKHFDGEKVQLQWILAMSGLDDVANVGAFGARLYGQSNWRSGAEWMRFLGSCARHIAAVTRGQWNDDHTPKCEKDCKKHSTLPHLAHCAFDCLILLEWYKTKKGIDDRPTNA